MIQPLERRRLFHFTFVQNGVLNFPGANELDDVLTVNIVGSSYRCVAQDGFVQDVPMSQVTAGFNINGGSGNDQITLGAGITLPATLIGGDGNDTINGGLGKDLITGDNGNDFLLGNGNRDLIHGGLGDDTISGGSKNDTLIGEGGNDVLVGSAGALDQVWYTEKTTTVSISLDEIANDGVLGEFDNVTGSCEVFYGGSGGDAFIGSGKNNILVGNGGDDTLIGGGGNDTLIGGDGNDLLEGQGGSDVLISSGDKKVDTLIGGSGIDTADKDLIDSVNSIP